MHSCTQRTLSDTCCTEVCGGWGFSGTAQTLFDAPGSLNYLGTRGTSFYLLHVVYNIK